jgi:hypothetical protein
LVPGGEKSSSRPWLRRRFATEAITQSQREHLMSRGEAKFLGLFNHNFGIPTPHLQGMTCRNSFHNKQGSTATVLFATSYPWYLLK